MIKISSIKLFAPETWTAFGDRTVSTLRSMPILLAIMMVGSAFFCVVALWTITGQCFMIIGNFGTFEVNGEQVTRAVFLAAMPKTYSTMLGTVAALMAVAYALWARKRWARELIMIVLLAHFGIVAYQTYVGDEGRVQFVLLAIVVAFVIVYLYLRSNVAKYFGDGE